MRSRSWRRRVGLKVPREGGREAAPREDKTDLYALLDAAASWYEGELPRSAEAQAYCNKRGLDADTIRRFRLGWAPAGFDGVIKSLGDSDRRRRSCSTRPAWSPAANAAANTTASASG